MGNKCPELREHRDLSTYGRKIYNARTETVAKLPSFREAWSKRWRCIIPTEHFFEPCWETGKSFRWLIQQHGEVPMGIADIYRKWRDPKGNPIMQGLGTHPILGAIDSMAAHREGYSPRCFCTMRKARSRTSGENLIDFLMAPSSQRLEPPQNPGRFSRIRRADYDSTSRQLDLHWANKTILAYKPVPEGVYRPLCSGPNPATCWEDRIAEECPKGTPKTRSAGSDAARKLSDLFGDGE